MSKSIIIKNFRFGLDTRRDNLTSQPGTLVQLVNGHVNQGAEVEQRMAFVKLGQLPTGCFDLLATPNSLMTFGSVTAPSMPAGLTGLVTYQRLRHPITTLSGTLDAPMTGVTTSCCFNGQAWVSATFGAATDFNQWATDGGNIHFYNGAPIAPNYLGVIHTQDATGAYANQLAHLALELVGQIPTYFGTTFTAATVVPSYVLLTGPVNVPFAVTTTFNSVHGTFQDKTQYDNPATAGVTAVGAQVAFYLVSGAAGAINTIVDANAVSLISAGVPFHTSLYQTALDVVAAINANTTTTGYTAAASLSSNNTAGVIVTASTTAGAAGNIVLTVNSTTIKVSVSPDTAGATGNTTYTLAGGVTGKAATAQSTYLLFFHDGGANQWNYGDTWNFTLVYNNVQYTVGAGNIAKLVPTACLPLATKVNFVAGTTWAFSKVGDATKWEQQDTGAGTITIADQGFSPTNAIALASYQGRMAILCRTNVQIWGIAASPSQYQQVQVLQNTGTFASLSVQSLGDLDVLYLSDTGVRSIRVRDSSLNAFVTDVGSPIDELIQDALLAGTPTSNAAACAVVEPESNRYWLYLGGSIYVLSYFPSLKISAWSTYLPTYLSGGVQVPFVPVKFVVYKGQVYVLDNANNVYVYGGVNNNTFDGCPVTVELPWLDDEDPLVEKKWQTLAFAATGQWNFQVATDIKSGTLSNVAAPFGSPTAPLVTTDSSFPYTGKVPFSGVSTHIKVLATSTTANTGQVSIGCLAMTYNPGNTR